MTPTVRRLVAWVLLFAMAWSSAAQAFASRVPAGDLAALGICSVAAAEAAGDPQQGPARSLGVHLRHCAFCSASAHAVLPTAPASLPARRVEAARFVLPRVEEPQRPVHPGSTCRPRGPPASASA